METLSWKKQMEPCRIREQEGILFCFSCFLVWIVVCLHFKKIKENTYHTLKLMSQQEFVKHLFVVYFCWTLKGIWKMDLPCGICCLVSEHISVILLQYEKFVLQMWKFGEGSWYVAESEGMWFLLCMCNTWYIAEPLFI